MGQYMLNKKKNFENLQNAINNYETHSILISPFSLGNRTELIFKNLEGKLFNFSVGKELSFFIDKEKIISLHLNGPHRPFKIEYQNERFQRLWNEDYHPEDPNLPNPTYSTLRNVIDDLLIEIRFKGKIKLNLDETIGNTDYWKIIS